MSEWRYQRETTWQSIAGAMRHPALWLTLAVAANVLEGAARKWLPGFSDGPGRALAYFSKDILFFWGTILILFQRQIKRPSLQTATDLGVPALALLTLGAIISCIQDYTPVGAFQSLRAVCFLPIAAFIYAGRARRSHLLGVASIVILLGTLNAGLALVQNSLPSSHILNKYAIDESFIHVGESGVRATGTFAYITGLAVLSALAIWAGMVVLSLAENWRAQVFGSMGILAGLGCAFASVSRGTIVTAAAMIALWALSSVKATRILWRACLIAAVIVLAAPLLLPEISERFVVSATGTFDRFTTAGDDNMGRAFGQVGSMWSAIAEHPQGTGLGTEQVGGNFVSTGRMFMRTYETQFPRIVADLGLLGLIGYFVMVAAVLLALQRAKCPTQSRWNAAVTATQIYLLGQFYGNVVFNHTGSAAVWLVVAAILAASPISKKARKRQVRPKVSSVMGRITASRATASKVENTSQGL